MPVALQPVWTLTGLPELPASLATASDLLDDIAAQGGSCPEVYRWHNGDWDPHSTSLPDPGFPLRDDEGYLVQCDNALTYVPGAGGGLARRPEAWQPPAEPVPLEPAANPTISDVLVTNHRDVAFAVTWRTDRPSTGWVEYQDLTGFQNLSGLEQVAHDDRGAEAVSTVHHVTLTGLKPQTTYYLRMHSGDAVDDNGAALYQVTTKETTMPPAPYLAYGQVEAPHGAFSDGGPAVGALVRAWQLDAEGGESEPLSALVDGWGYWSLNLPLRDCADVRLQLKAIGPRGSEAELTLSSCEVQPAPLLVIPEQNLPGVYLPLVMR